MGSNLVHVHAYRVYSSIKGLVWHEARAIALSDHDYVYNYYIIDILLDYCNLHADLEFIPVPGDDLGSTDTPSSSLDLPEIPNFDF